MLVNTECEVIFFVSSSGHCTLDCPYCIIDPIAKREPSLNYGDMEFLIETFQKKAFFAFSGKGDFFAGYKKSEKLLASLLEREVEIALDINGVLIHEFPELSLANLDKIRSINLTMHYQQLKEKNLRNIWAENARILIEKKGNDMLLGTIVSPLLIDQWEESLSFYDEEIFNGTGKKVVLIKDINRPYKKEEDDFLSTLNERFAHLVERVHQEDFAEVFLGYDKVLCPAGSFYFRVWNNGDLQGCPNIPELSQCGNVKERKIVIRAGLFCCSEMIYCDCNAIEALGKMVYE